MTEFRIQRILCPIDFSDLSLKGVEYALALARNFDAEILIVYVVDDLYDTYITRDEELGVEIQTTEKKASNSKLADYVQSLKYDKISYEVLEGKPYEALADKARDWGVDHIVIASHGRAGFSRLFMGSTAEKVVRHAPCPVTVITKDFLAKKTDDQS